MNPKISESFLARLAAINDRYRADQRERDLIAHMLVGGASIWLSSRAADSLLRMAEDEHRRNRASGRTE